MFQTLQGRITAAFGAVIVLAAVLIGFVAFIATRFQFNMLALEEAEAQAINIAAYVESQYNLSGGWTPALNALRNARDLEARFAAEDEVEDFDAPFFVPTDWNIPLAEALGQYGTGNAADAILDGTFDPTDFKPLEEIQQWITLKK